MLFGARGGMPTRRRRAPFHDVLRLLACAHRVLQANLGAKNHAVVLPDADKEATLNAIAGAAFGAAGQRCMALSVAVFVGAARDWVPELANKARGFKVGVARGSDVPQRGN